MDDLGAVFPHHVAAQHLAAGDLHHQLQQRRRPPFGQGLGHGPEFGPIDPHAIGAAARHGLLLAEPHGGELGLAEHRHGHQPVVHLAGLVAVHRVGKGPALINGNRREVDAVGHVSDGIDVGDGGALVGIHADAITLHGDAGGLQVQPLQERPPARGQQHPPAAEAGGFAIRWMGWHRLGLHLERPGAARDGDGAHLAAQVDAFGLHRLLHHQGGFPVEAPQDLLPPHQLGDLDAKAIEDAGEFTGDEACPHDHDAFGEGLEQKDLIAHPAQLCSRDLGPLGPAAHANQDPIGRVVLLTNRDGAAIGKAPPARDELDAGFL